MGASSADASTQHNNAHCAPKLGAPYVGVYDVSRDCPNAAGRVQSQSVLQVARLPRSLHLQPLSFASHAPWTDQGMSISSISSTPSPTRSRGPRPREAITRLPRLASAVSVPWATPWFATSAGGGSSTYREPSRFSSGTAPRLGQTRSRRSLARTVYLLQRLSSRSRTSVTSSSLIYPTMM